MHISDQHISPDGILTGGFGLHDAVLTGLQVEARQALVLSVRTGRQRVVSLRFEGLGSFGICGLRDEAILSAVFVFHLDAIPDPALQNPAGPFHVLFGGDLPAPQLQAAARGIIDAAAFEWLVHVECSYGGALALLCNAIDVTG